MAKSENNMSNERYRNALIRKLMEFSSQRKAVKNGFYRSRQMLSVFRL